MNIIKKIFIITPIILLTKVSIAFAQDPGSMLGAAGASAGLKNIDTPELIGQIIKGFIGFIGSIFMLLIIYAGFLWMTAQGNEESVNKAKKIIQNSTIGLLIAVLSYIIVQFVFNTLTTAGL